MRNYLILIVFFFFPLISFSQDCPSERNITFTKVSPCADKKGELIMQVEGVNIKWKSENLALYRVDLQNFEKNRLNDEGLKIQGNKITFSEIEGGLYKVAIYVESCLGYPKPALVPQEPIEIESVINCD